MLINTPGNCDYTTKVKKTEPWYCLALSFANMFFDNSNFPEQLKYTSLKTGLSETFFIRKRKITDNKVISAAGRSRHQLGNKSTCPHVLQLMMTLLYVETHVRTCTFIARPTLNPSYSWWWLCHMSKRTFGHTFVSPSRRLMRPAVDDDFVICRYARTGMCLYCQSDV